MEINIKPFLKWAGGKRWLTKTLFPLIPEDYGRYVEPFLGSGAIFFALSPQEAFLSDINAELVNTYLAIRDHPGEILLGLRDLHDRHSHDLYYLIRNTHPDSDIQAAIRFLYLNRTCWNGLYRVNRKNEFNVPIGTKSSVLFDDDDFFAVSNVLKKATISAIDFEEAIDSASSNDLIYVDPPYTVKHNFNGFLKYNQSIFSWDDQVRLHDALVRARTRGCHILVSNANHESIHELYSDLHITHTIPRASVIAGQSKARGLTSEFLVVHHA